MAYGHAERNLAALRLLEAETEELLRSLPQSGPRQSLQTDCPGELTASRRANAWALGSVHDDDRTGDCDDPW
jgi:hypothetical protein